MATIIDTRQIATIIAALRHWQHCGMVVPSPLPFYLAALASDRGRVSPLDATEVDTLCEALGYQCFRSINYHPRAVVLHEAGDLAVLADPEVEIERIATDNVRGLVDGQARELQGLLGNEFKHLVPAPEHL